MNVDGVLFLILMNATMANVFAVVNVSIIIEYMILCCFNKPAMLSNRLSLCCMVCCTFNNLLIRTPSRTSAEFCSFFLRKIRSLAHLLLQMWAGDFRDEPRFIKRACYDYCLGHCCSVGVDLPTYRHRPDWGYEHQWNYFPTDNEHGHDKCICSR